MPRSAVTSNQNENRKKGPQVVRAVKRLICRKSDCAFAGYGWGSALARQRLASHQRRVMGRAGISANT